MLFLLGTRTVFAQTDPCSLTATRTVANGQTVEVSDWFPSGTSTSNEVIDIGVGSTLVIDKDFTFNNCKFRCAENALILTQAPSSGVRLFTLLNSTLFSCNSSTMWKGIQVVNGTRIRFVYNFIYDADKAIYFPGGYNDTHNILEYTRFIDNRIGIQVGSVSGFPATVNFNSCRGNKFAKTGLLNNTTQSQYPEAGIQVNKSNLGFGTAGFRNIFEGILTGITLQKGAFAQVANCDFKNMILSGTETFPLSPTQGTGIYVKSSSLTVTRVSGSNCRFDGNASHGIYLENHFGAILIERAEFTGGQRYGIFAGHCLSNSPITIQDNTFNLNHVRCYSTIFCERPPGTSSATNSYIRRNQISMPLRSTPAAQNGAILDVVSIVGATNTFEISKNRINFSDWPSQDKNGIYLTGSGDNHIVKQNRITFTRTGSMTSGVDFSNLGITFESMTGSGNTISDDTIRSILTSQTTHDSTNDRSLLKCGIHVNNSHAPTICNNDIDSTYRAVHFGGMNLGTVFGLNDMRKHVFALYCGKNHGMGDTDIGEQNRRGNTWSTSSGDYINGGVGAIYVDDNNTPLFKFRYDPTSGITGQVPPSATPIASDWFLQEGGAFDPCARVSGLFEDGEIAIAEGEYPYSTPVEDWDQQRYLFNKLIRNPGIEDGVTEVEDFIGDKEWTSPHLFAQALYDYEKAFYPPRCYLAKSLEHDVIEHIGKKRKNCRFIDAVRSRYLNDRSRLCGQPLDSLGCDGLIPGYFTDAYGHLYRCEGR